ncbi:MAG: hypothetical protein AB1540_05830 [Bdellovibrionota bacterium]
MGIRNILVLFSLFISFAIQARAETISRCDYLAQDPHFGNWKEGLVSIERDQDRVWARVLFPGGEIPFLSHDVRKVQLGPDKLSRLPAAVALMEELELHASDVIRVKGYRIGLKQTGDLVWVLRFYGRGNAVLGTSALVGELSVTCINKRKR